MSFSRSYSFLPLLFLSLAFTSPRSAAQIRPGDAGFRMLGKAGTFGTLCRGFTCTPVQATVSRGETVTLELRGKKDGPFVLAISTAAPVCISIPTIYQSLNVLPILALVPGVLSIQDFIRACPGGIGKMSLPIPTNLAPKSQFAMQGVVTSFGQSTATALAFTQTLVVTVN